MIVCNKHVDQHFRSKSARKQREAEDRLHAERLEEIKRMHEFLKKRERGL